MSADNHLHKEGQSEVSSRPRNGPPGDGIPRDPRGAVSDGGHLRRAGGLHVPGHRISK